MGQEWYLSYDITVRIQSGYVYSTHAKLVNAQEEEAIVMITLTS